MICIKTIQYQRLTMAPAISLWGDNEGSSRSAHVGGSGAALWAAPDRPAASRARRTCGSRRGSPRPAGGRATQQYAKIRVGGAAAGGGARRRWRLSAGGRGGPGAAAPLNTPSGQVLDLLLSI